MRMMRDTGTQRAPRSSAARTGAVRRAAGAAADERGRLWLDADAWHLERALANLVGNAVTYTRQARRFLRRVDVALSAGGGGVVVTIADTGLGMDPAALALIGQPRERLAAARGTTGMEMGVYLSRGIIEQHGGTVTYASAGPGYGTTVTV